MASFWKGQSPALAAPDGSGRLRYGLEILLTAFAYFALAKAGLALASIHPSASPIWPPTGFAFAILLLRGLRLAPAIFLGALAANATTDGSLATAAAIAAGNTLEGAAGTWLIGRWSGGVATFDTTIGVVRFSLVSIAATIPLPDPTCPMAPDTAARITTIAACDVADASCSTSSNSSRGLVSCPGSHGSNPTASRSTFLGSSMHSSARPVRTLSC